MQLDIFSIFFITVAEIKLMTKILSRYYNGFYLASYTQLSINSSS